jgi:hypothetical protein
MKTIDTKSLFVGAGITLLFLTLTSEKLPNEDNNLKVFSRDLFLEIYNPTTNTLYEYSSGVGARTKDGEPGVIYKIAADGSSIQKQ